MKQVLTLLAIKHPAQTVQQVLIVLIPQAQHPLHVMQESTHIQGVARAPLVLQAINVQMLMAQKMLPVLLDLIQLDQQMIAQPALQAKLVLRQIQTP